MSADHRLSAAVPARRPYHGIAKAVADKPGGAQWPGRRWGETPGVDHRLEPKMLWLLVRARRNLARLKREMHARRSTLTIFRQALRQHQRHDRMRGAGALCAFPVHPEVERLRRV